jgi:hypothetical protein
VLNQFQALAYLAAEQIGTQHRHARSREFERQWPAIQPRADRDHRGGEGRDLSGWIIGLQPLERIRLSSACISRETGLEIRYASVSMRVTTGAIGRGVPLTTCSKCRSVDDHGFHILGLQRLAIAAIHFGTYER